MKFDDNLKKIEEIAGKLDNPDLSLSDGVNLYEEGVGLAKECLTELNTIKGNINTIKKELYVFTEETLD